MAKILIIDDDATICDMLSCAIKSTGHASIWRHTLSGGLRALEEGDFDVVLLDVGLPDGNGMDAIPQIQKIECHPEIIIITASGDKNGAELAIRSGAWDYIEKPVSVHGMILPVMRALQYREERKGNDKRTAVRQLKLDGMVGGSARMKNSFDQVAQVANNEVNVLITGETGTGKELIASAIHRNSMRAGKPFVVLDCSVLPETLVESILFGHDKGAFTGAEKHRTGLVKQADGGTLFLDEVGELPLSVQKSFLRVLQERRFRPVGSDVEVTSDFRLIAATNRDLKKMAQEKTFRADLLFRLTSFVIELPPLRERTDDISELARHHISDVCKRHRIGLKGFAPEFMNALAVYDWPGNVRELFHALERALAAAFYEPTLFPQHLPPDIRIHLARRSLENAGSTDLKGTTGTALSKRLPSFKEYRDQMDRIYFHELASLTGGSIQESCQISGLSRSRLYDLLKLHHVESSIAAG